MTGFQNRARFKTQCNRNIAEKKAAYFLGRGERGMWRFWRDAAAGFEARLAVMTAAQSQMDYGDYLKSLYK